MAKNPKILRVLKALYGCPDAPQLWNKHLTKVLEGKLKFERMHYDSCLYQYVDEDGVVLMTCSVDDLVITGNNDRKIAEVEKFMKEEWSCTQYERVKSVLGVNCFYKYTKGAIDNELFMDMKGKVESLLETHRGAELKGKSYSTPHVDGEGSELADPSTEVRAKITQLDEYLLENYRNVVGALIYIAVAGRPDISYAVGRLSRAMHSPTYQHVAWLKRCMGYLKSCPQLAIRYSQQRSAMQELFNEMECGDSPIQAMSMPEGAGVGFSDASYAPNDEKERKSVTGFLFLVYGCVVCWKSKLQPITAGSTHESELIALATAANEGVWLHRLLHEIRCVRVKPVQFLNMLADDPERVLSDSPEEERGLPTRPLLIFGDNRGSLFTSNNPDVSNNSKHLDVRYYKIREYIRDRLLAVRYCNTADNLADFFTKGLERVKFERFRSLIFNGASVKFENVYALWNGEGNPEIECWDALGTEEEVRSTRVLLASHVSDWQES